MTDNIYKYKNSDGKYIIPVSWRVCSTITVEADSLGDAVDTAKELMNSIPLCTDPLNNHYEEDSYRIDVDVEEDAITAQSYQTRGNIFIDKKKHINIL